VTPQATGRVRLADIAPRLAAARDAHEYHQRELDYCASGAHDSYFPDDNGRCPVCGDLHGSTLDGEPYDFNAARRELLAVHAYLRRFGLEQLEGSGQWGRVQGYYEVEWCEVGNTVQAIEWCASVVSEDAYIRGLEQFHPGITEAPPVDAEEAA